MESDEVKHHTTVSRIVIFWLVWQYWHLKFQLSQETLHTSLTERTAENMLHVLDDNEKSTLNYILCSSLP